MKRKTKKLVLTTVALAISNLVATGAPASVVAIIDSGVDYRHVSLTANRWTNELEEQGQKEADDDANGYVDDVFGWNFAENNNLVIDYKYLGTFSQDPYKFFDIQLKIFLGTASQEEVAWLKAKVQDEEFIKELSKFGNFIHGTHVAGISAAKLDSAKVLPIKLIPTEVSPMIAKAEAFASMQDKSVSDELTVMLIKAFLNKMAVQQMDQLEVIGKYVQGHAADVANGSFGTGYAQAKMIVNALFQAMAGREPTPEEEREICTDFLNTLIREGSRFVKASPNTLFVFAAGNDGTNNDVEPSSPTNVKEPNTIAVAAGLGFSKLASFSNYGEKMVDVVAPGVGIHSAIPGDEYLKVSGTSQAAPYVSKIAAAVKDVNPELVPEEIKRIIMGTVDKKEQFRGKVASGGVVNGKRAVRAAALSRDLALAKAISQARSEVEDQQEDKNFVGIEMGEAFILPLPSLFNL